MSLRDTTVTLIVALPLKHNLESEVPF